MDPDLLCLQECLDWTAEQLAAFSPLPHTHLGQARARGSGRRFQVGVGSRFPLHDVREHNHPAFIGHCLLEFAVEGLRCYVAHFDSHTENLRYVEARYLRSLLGEGPRLLCGDLNCLSPRDPYPDDLEALLRRAGTQKYDLPPRTDVIAELQTQGWRDALYAHGPPASWVTAPRDRGGVHIDYRTDYIFVGPGVEVQGCRVHPLEHEESDHFPVSAEITWSARS